MALFTATIGIDPGASGGIALMTREDVTVVKMPSTTKDFVEILKEWPHSFFAKVFVERVNSSPQMGVVSAFKFGKSAGLIEGSVIALNFPLEYVSPQKWQKEFGLLQKGRQLGTGKVDKKNRNKAKAQELFPQLKITHATADALLIAEYGRRQLVK